MVATLGGHVVQHAVARAGIDPAQVESGAWPLCDAREGRGPQLSRDGRRSGQACRLTVVWRDGVMNGSARRALQKIAMAAQSIIAG